MIPKIVHYTWFSDAPYPQKIQDCLDSWKDKLPDYTFIHWDMEKIKDINVPYLKEAISERKWAFASDYIRFYAVYHYGGIYLDTDVKVYETFDELLTNSCFIGRESSWHIDGHSTVCYLSSHCFGATEGHPFLKDTLDYYEHTHFIRCTDKNIPTLLRLDLTISPYIQSILAQKYGYNWNFSCQGHQSLDAGIQIYPSECFDATTNPYDGKKYCRHLAAGSWRITPVYNPIVSFKYKIEWRIIKIINILLKKMGYTTIKCT